MSQYKYLKTFAFLAVFRFQYVYCHLFFAKTRTMLQQDYIHIVGLSNHRSGSINHVTTKWKQMFNGWLLKSECRIL
ncbi:Uncharacterised protein [Actinobacillus pleuropneumoniae]|nr:Uncharacterised protein [Actinobacillus pleuropneumoniae]